MERFLVAFTKDLYILMLVKDHFNWSVKCCIYHLFTEAPHAENYMHCIYWWIAGCKSEQSMHFKEIIFSLHHKWNATGTLSQGCTNFSLEVSYIIHYSLIFTLKWTIFWPINDIYVLSLSIVYTYDIYLLWWCTYDLS